MELCFPIHMVWQMVISIMGKNKMGEVESFQVMAEADRAT